MAETRKASGHLAIWALAYIGLSVDIILRLLPLTDLGTESSVIDTSLSIFAPFLGAWLGARHGRAALVPLLIAAPFTLLEFNLQIAEPITFYYGMGVGTLVLTGATTLIFASPPVEAPKRSLPGLLIDAIVLIALTAAASACLNLDDPVLSICLSNSGLAAIVGFILVASGRRSAVSVILIFVAVIALLCGLEFAGMPPLFVSANADNYVYQVSAGWENAPVLIAYLTLPAALAGAAVRQMRMAHARGHKPRLGFAIAACAAVILVPAVLSPADKLVRQALAPKEEAAVSSAAPADATLVRFQIGEDQSQPAPETIPETIVVTAAPRYVYAPPDVSIGIWPLLIIAAAAFVMGRATPRAAFFLPLALETSAAACAAVNAWLLPPAPRYDEEIPLAANLARVVFDHADAFVALGVVAWMFAWLGARQPVSAPMQSPMQSSGEARQ